MKNLDFEKLDDEELWSNYAKSLKELRKRKLIRTRNVTSERGEQLVLKIYNSIPNEPKLQLAPPGTRNIDAISKMGERYAIKTVCIPNRATGVFYGLEPKDSDKKDKKIFEHVVIVILNEELQPLEIWEIDWEKFLKHKKWHSRARAWNLTVNKNMERDARKVYVLRRGSK